MLVLNHARVLRGSLGLRTEVWSLVIGVGDVLEEAVHLSERQRVVQRLKRPDVGRPILPD